MKNRRDAQGQFAPSQAKRDSIGVSSAKPTVVTGSEDATVNKVSQRRKKAKDWDLNYDISEVKEDNDQG
ncbi:ribosomal protein S3 [Rhizobium mesoamericanum]|uniref:hypothetical protein n=1 Tax=Rhizobium mesoamericanum TaxID=1079800 RepID=UPI00277EB802|nr:hypothetical protein [Rhizobium mesoamericanum]MDQ0562442.1 ribosomal protein S3 [Rhizobium mesoamericanum]